MNDKIHLKPKRSRNPVYLKGYEAGFDAGKAAVVDLIAGRLEDLQGASGIGPKTWGRIEAALLQIREAKG